MSKYKIIILILVITIISSIGSINTPVIINKNRESVTVILDDRNNQNNQQTVKYANVAQHYDTWSHTYGGTGVDRASSLVQTSDGGYALAGETDSYGAGKFDMWLVKTEANGAIQWNETYGGTDIDRASSLIQTSDGGYVLAGETDSYGRGMDDTCLVNIDADGNMQWFQTYGGTGSDRISSLVQTSDGGYALAGWTSSYGGGIFDMWLVKTDADGELQWNETYDRSSLDLAYSLVQTSDGGYALAGWTSSFGAGRNDMWLVKINVNRGIQWNETYGGTGNDLARSLIQTSDGGYALAGETGLYTEDTAIFDMWMVKTDASGDMQEFSSKFTGSLTSSSLTSSTIRTDKIEDTGSVSWDVDIDLVDTGFINFGVSTQAALKHDPIYNINPGDSVTIISEITAGTSSVTVSLENLGVFSDLEGTYIIPLGDAVGTFSIPVPSASVNIPLVGEVGIYLEIKTAIRVDIVVNGSGIIAGESYAIFYSAGSKSFSLKIPSDAKTGDFTIVKSNFGLMITHLAISLKAGGESVQSIETGTLQESFPAPNKLSMDVEVGKSKSNVPGFELVFAVLVMPGILLKRKLRKNYPKNQ